MDIKFNPSPLSDASPKQLYDLAGQKRFEDEARGFVEQAMREATDKALLLGMTAYSASLAARGIESLRPFLTQEPTHEEKLQLVRWAPTGEAIMFIGEPEWPVREYADFSQIKIQVPYELVKAEDRPLLARSNGNYH